MAETTEYVQDEPTTPKTITRKKISIDPITRLEGHGKIEIFLNETNNVDKAYLQIPILRGFEKFCIGRPVEELPRIVTRICGVCPEAHHLASVKATDMLYSADPPVPAKKLRELFYSAHMIHSHIAHFYALAAPDFVLGPDANPADRNILGVVSKVGVEVGKEVIKHRSLAQKIQTIIGGKATHPVSSVPGGQSKSITPEQQQEIIDISKSCIKFSEFSLDLFNDVVLKNDKYVEIITSDPFQLELFNMGLVDKNNKVTFYEGDVRVTDLQGMEFAKFAPKNYLDHISEHVLEYTYLKPTYLKQIGWKGLIDGPETSLTRVAPLGRLNASDGMATPNAQEHFEKMYELLGKNSTATLAQHWARLIELMYASERMLELAEDPDITSKDLRTPITYKPEGMEGVGIVEAPRGTLIHHYKTDEKGIATMVNLIVATANNYGAMCMSVENAAKGFIKNGEINQGLLNICEMAFRAYDPCMSCATHSVTKKMPMLVNIRNRDGSIYKILKQ
ncbi:MAG: Ni/Fe hydrogenase subunit alpha [Candidatus Kariarchaeaceae archaeon]|jgi:F420-non-reducing hydrogenase large subunit